MAHLLDFDLYVQSRENRIVQVSQIQSWMCMVGNFNSSEPKSTLQLLRSCSPEVNIALEPVLRLQNCKVVESLLFDIREESQLLGVSFSDLIETPDVIDRLLHVVNVFTQEGVMGVEKLFALLQASKTSFLVQESRKQANNDADVFVMLLNAAGHANERGLLEFERSCMHEAIVCFRYANSVLEALRSEVGASFQSTEEMSDLHVAILKNISQAAVHLKLWNEALETAGQATKEQEDDPMAWICKADAMVGFADIEEVLDCLRKAEEIAIGHQEHDSIQHEIWKRQQRMQNGDFAPTKQHLSNESHVFEEPACTENAVEAPSCDNQDADYQAFAEQVWRGWRHFEVLGEVLPMQVGEVGVHGEGITEVEVTPQDVLKVWGEQWNLPYIGRIRFQAPEGSETKWLNHRNDFIPPYPAATRLVVQSFTNYQSILDNLKLALKSHAKRAPKIIQFVENTQAQFDLERRRKDQELATLLAKAPHGKNLADVRKFLQKR